MTNLIKLFQLYFTNLESNLLEIPSQVWLWKSYFIIVEGLYVWPKATMSSGVLRILFRLYEFCLQCLCSNHLLFIWTPVEFLFLFPQFVFVLYFENSTENRPINSMTRLCYFLKIYAIFFNNSSLNFLLLFWAISKNGTF